MYMGFRLNMAPFIMQAIVDAVLSKDDTNNENIVLHSQSKATFHQLRAIKQRTRAIAE